MSVSISTVRRKIPGFPGTLHRMLTNGIQWLYLGAHACFCFWFPAAGVSGMFGADACSLAWVALTCERFL